MLSFRRSSIESGSRSASLCRSLVSSATATGLSLPGTLGQEYALGADASVVDADLGADRRPVVDRLRGPHRQANASMAGGIGRHLRPAVQGAEPVEITRVV